MYSENSQEPLFKQEIQIKSDKHQRSIGLDIRFVLDEEIKPLIIFVHGFKGFKDWGHFNLMADNFARRGFVFAKINLSHNGTSPTNKIEFVDLEAFGKQTFSVDLDDLDTVINYFHSSDYIFKSSTNLEAISLMGHSRAGALVLLKALEDTRIHKVIALASVSRADFLFNEENIREIQQNGVIYIENARTNQKMPIYKEVYEDCLQNAQKFDLEKRLPQLQIPLLLIHGKGDTTAPPENSVMLKKWSVNATFIPLENGDHTFGGKEPYTEAFLPVHSEELIDEVITFLNN